MRDGHCARSTHAEQNAIVQAARHGTPIGGATVYCTSQPCLTCAKLLVNAGVRRVVFEGAYPDELAVGILREADIELVKHAGEAAP